MKKDNLTTKEVIIKIKVTKEEIIKRKVKK
jgi:hypothetical protein